jgi:mono/diheme cytochrome c family protein
MRLDRVALIWTGWATLVIFGAVFPADAAEPEAQPQSAAPETQASGNPAPSTEDVKKLFAANCSWCHGAYGMEADKGPRLAGTEMTERQIQSRIRNGKPGMMPSFRKVLSDEQISAFASYIKSLKPPPE